VKARVVAPVRGAQWLLEGVRLFGAAPLGWLVLVFTYLMGTMLLSAIPRIGPVVVGVVVPALSVGFMAAGRAASRKQTLDLAMLLSGFRERLPSQLVLGVVYVAGFLLAIAGSALGDGGTLARLILGAAPAQEAPPGEGMPTAMLLALVLYLPTMAMLWFAPVLVAWHGLAPGRAVFYSLVACWLNLRAFLAYGVALLLGLFVVIGMVTLAAALLAGSAASMRALIFPLALAVLPVLFASYFASYRDVFGAAEDA
jgi:hypothetical protein